MSIDVQIESSWKEVLSAEFDKPYFTSLTKKIRSAFRAGKVVYPPGALIFNAFNTTPFGEVKVVILGQDPYHGAGQAMGLSFSVPRGIPPPPSLKNIYKELQLDLNIPAAKHGDLTFWAEQGVFLLNAMLTVEKGKAGSHKDFGWQIFTDKVIETLSFHREGLVFLLWGKFAQSKLTLIDELKHHVLQSAHPSPFTGSAFFNNHHFSRTNELLLAQGDKPMDWRLPD